MKAQGIWGIVFFIFLSGCRQLDIEPGTPKCIVKNIKSFEKNSGCAGIHVDAYWFQNKTVYVFETGNCGADMDAPVLDSDCNRLGSLGGFAGNSYINGVDFFKNAVLVKTVWRK